MMKTHKKLLLSLLLLPTVLAASCGSPSSPVLPEETPTAESPAGEEESPVEEDPVVFSSPLLLEKLQTELGKEEILPSDLEKIVSLSIAADEFVFAAKEGESLKSIIHFFEDEFEYDGVRFKGYGTLTSLEDLKYFKNLKKLYVTLQPDIDYSSLPVEILKNLEILWIYQCKLSSLSFLERAEHLKNLTVNTNSIRDLTPVSHLKNLSRLRFDFNQVEDLTPLSGLTSLTEISGYSNSIKDLTPLENLVNLTRLSLYNNGVEDLTPLKNLTSLTELELISNNIRDVSPLKDFPSFETLRLSGNPIENIQVLEHITTLEFEP